jgi:hypothetical protein
VFVSRFSIFKKWGQDSPRNKIRWTDNHVNQKNTQTGDEKTQALTKQETQLAIEKLNNNTAPAKFLKHGGQDVINKIQELMGTIWEKESISEEWKLSII